jgi:hypothetical protein
MFFRQKWFPAFAGMTNQDVIRDSLEVFTTEYLETANKTQVNARC